MPVQNSLQQAALDLGGRIGIPEQQRLRKRKPRQGTFRDAYIAMLLRQRGLGPQTPPALPNAKPGGGGHLAAMLARRPRFNV